VPAFLSPLFLLGAAAAAIPIVLHLLKREPELRVKFAAVKLIMSAPVEQAARRRLREWLLLALRVAALVLLSLAFARPFFEEDPSAASSGVTVVALDTSLSLSAPGRMDRARALAREAIGRAPAGDDVAIVAFADVAQVVALPSADRGLALAAIDRAAAGLGATRYRAGLTAAADLIGAHGGDSARIVVVTDLQESGWDADDRVSMPAFVDLQVLDVGPLATNLAVTRVRPASDDRVVATIRNAGPEPRTVRVRLAVDDVETGETVASIGAQQSAEVTLAGVAGSTAAVSLDDSDGLVADNVRHLVLDTSATPSVLVVTANGDLAREAFYVQQALLAEGTSGAAYNVEGVGAEGLSSWNAVQIDDYSTVILMSTRGLDRQGRELLADFIRRNGSLFVAVGPGVDGEVAADTLGRVLAITVSPDSGSPDAAGGARTLTPADARHPVLRKLGAAGSTLGLVAFQRVANVDGATCQVLARFTTGESALVDCASGGGHALVFASDLNHAWNDFPRHATFVPFLHEVVAYLTGGRTRVGEYLIGNVPPGVEPEPGIATLPPRTSGGTPRLVAVNVDPDESDPARLSADQFQTAVTRSAGASIAQGPAKAQEQEAGQPIWRYALMLMMGMLVMESFVGIRTA
jgi:hypothetical protein